MQQRSLPSQLSPVRVSLWTRLVPRDGFASQVLKLAGGTTLVQAGMVVFAPILSRLYGPEEFAQYALFAVFASLAAVLATGRYEFALMLPEKEADAGRVLVLAALLPMAMTLLISLCIVGYGVLESRVVDSWLWFVPLAAAVYSWFLVASRWQARKRRFGTMACAEIVASLTALSFQVAAGVLLDSPSGVPLIIGQIMGRAIALPILCKEMRTDWSAIKSPVRFSTLAETAKKFRHFPLFSCTSSFIGKLNMELPKIMLAVLFGPQYLGFYSLTMRVLGTPTSIIGQAFGQAFFPRISEYRMDGMQSKRLLRKAVIILAVIISVPGVILFFWSERLFGFVFGEQWAVSGHFARLLIPVLVVQFIVQPIALSMQAFEKQRAVFLWQISSLCVLATTFGLNKRFGDVDTAIFCYSLAFASLLVIYLAMTLHYAQQIETQSLESVALDDSRSTVVCDTPTRRAG